MLIIQVISICFRTSRHGITHDSPSSIGKQTTVMSDDKKKRSIFKIRANKYDKYLAIATVIPIFQHHFIESEKKKARKKRQY